MSTCRPQASAADRGASFRFITAGIRMVYITLYDNLGYLRSSKAACYSSLLSSAIRLLRVVYTH